MYFDINTAGKIITAFGAQADSSVCMSELEAHYMAHPARWQTAFRFLSELFPAGQTPAERKKVLDTLERGRVVLSDDVYANIEDYIPKPVEQGRGESHRQYIDIQYVAAGTEYIGLTRATDLPLLEAYNADRDIAFYRFEPHPCLYQWLLADSTKFFVFFPADIHAPGIRVSAAQPQPVTKIVVKVRY